MYDKILPHPRKEPSTMGVESGFSRRHGQGRKRSKGLSAIDRTTIVRGKLRVLLWGRDHVTHDMMWDALVDRTLVICDRNNDQDETVRTWARHYTAANRRKNVASTIGAIILNEERQSRHWVLDAIEEAIGEVSKMFTGMEAPSAPWMTDRGRLPEMIVSALEVAKDGIFQAIYDENEDLILDHASTIELIVGRLKERV